MTPHGEKTRGENSQGENSLGAGGRRDGWRRVGLHALVFLGGGLALWLGKRAAGEIGWNDAPPQPLVVAVRAEASPGEVERATERAMLLAFAERAGFVRADETVRRRLIDNMRFVGDDGPSAHEDSDEEALEAALALGMQRSDPVARERLLWLARESLASRVVVEPTDEDLAGYLAEHPERFRRPDVIAFEQVFLLAETGDERVVAALEELRRGERVKADPSLLPRQLEADRERVAARFGQRFAEELADAPLGEWTVVASSFGSHVVRVARRSLGEVPPLAAIRLRVRHAYLHDRRDVQIRAALERMRAAYAIDVRSAQDG